MKTCGRKTVVITGCDSGMGHDLALLCAEKDYAVVASYLERDPFRGVAGILSYRCDLRKESDIQRFARSAMNAADREGNLYALVNNAGIAKGGPLENLPMKIVREVMEVNYFGLVSLTGKLLPHLIRSGGRILINGSMAGRIALPFLGPYAASKFALEGYADSLRREMRPFGVRVALLETAGVATPIWNKARKMKLSDYPAVYRKSLRLFMRNFIEDGNRGMDQRAAARRMLDILESARMKPRYIIAKSTLVSRLERRIPDSLFDRICVKLFGMDYGNVRKR